MNKLHLFVPLMLLSLSVPCQAGKPVDERPELYKIMINGAGVGLEVHRVDGAKPPFMKSRWRLESGRHRIEGIGSLLYHRDRKDYQASFALEFEAKAGQTYMLSVVPDARIGNDTHVCLMEEPRDMPKADISAFGGGRHPGADAVQAACAPIVMTPV
jgi:hypothetical protein